jgi:hypothetical protein
MNPNGGGFAATVLPSERRAGYGAAPPASRVATAIATRRALRPALDPGALYGPSPRSGRRAGAKPLPAQPHGAHDPNPTKQSLYGYRGLPFTIITSPTPLQRQAFELLAVSHRHGYT